MDCSAAARVPGARGCRSPAGLAEGRERAACWSKLGPCLKVLCCAPLCGKLSEVGLVSTLKVAEYLSTGSAGDSVRGATAENVPGAADTPPSWEKIKPFLWWVTVAGAVGNGP